MKNKHQLYLSNYLYPEDSPQKNSSYPVKSPSPDKKRSNIITPTKSPEVNQIQRNMTPTKLNYKTVSHAGDTSLPDKSSSTRFYTTNYNTEVKQHRQYTTTNKRQFSDLQNIMPQEFIIGHSRSRSSYKQNELDYIRLLQQKQRTIKQLHQIIQMINRNNTNTQILSFTNSQFYDSHNFNNLTLKESYQTVFAKSKNPQNKSQNTIQQMKNQIKILTIQNQKLLHLVQRTNTSSKTKLHRENEELINQQIANKKIQQLRENLYKMEQTLRQTDSKYQNCFRKLKRTEEEVKQRDEQNMKLLKILKEIKDRQQQDRKYQTMKESTVSSSGSGSKVQKQKMSLIMIKQQYQESLNTFKNVVYQEAQAMVQSMQNQIQQMHKKLDKMGIKVVQLQKLKMEMSSKKTLDLSQIEMRDQQKQRRQIQSILLQKTLSYQQQLMTQRDNNQKFLAKISILQSDKFQLQKDLKDLSKKYDLLVQDKKQKNNTEEIQDINFRIKDSQIKKLRQLLIQNEKISHQKIQELTNDFQRQKNKALQLQKQILEQKRKYESIIQNLNSIIQGKSSEINKIQSHYKQKIQNLKSSLTQASSIKVSNQQSKWKTQVSQYKILLQKSELKLNQYEQQIDKQRQQFEQQKISTEEKIQKLVMIYQKQLQMLKNTIANKSIQIAQKNSEDNLAMEMHENQLQLYRQEIKGLQQKNNTFIQQNKQIKKLQNDLAKQLQTYQINMQIKHKNQLTKIRQLQAQVQVGQNTIQKLQKQLSNSTFLLQTNKKLSQANRDLFSANNELSQLKNKLTLKCTQLAAQLQLCQHQKQNFKKQKQTLTEESNIKNIQMLEQVQRYQAQNLQAQQIIAKLNKEINQHRQNLHSLRDQNIILQNNFNQIIKYKKETDSILPELYELRQLVNQSALTKSKGEKNKAQSYEKLQLEYQTKLQETKQLHFQIADLKDALLKEKQSRQLINEKVIFLQKNIAIYQNQLKERKQFCQKLVTQKSKVDRELLYMKKSKFDEKNQDTETMKCNLINRINRLVQLEQNRQKNMGYIIQSSRQLSPIKKVQELTSSVYSRHN